VTSEDPALHLIDVAGTRGLEIGPLNRPRVHKSEGPIYYVDHCSTEDLRRAYSANSLMRPHLDEIVEVDYVIKDGAELSDVVGADGPFGYLIASHVLEHLANPVGWLRDAASVLAPGGLVSLVVPDKRYCFDINRLETRPQDWVDWYLRDLRAPSYSQLFDFFAHVTTIDGMVDTHGVWVGTANYDGVRRSDVPDADVAAWAMCLQYREKGNYMDVHTGVYTPASLLSLFELAMRLELLDYEVAHFVPTRRDSLEFHVSLRSWPGLPREQAIASIDAARHQLSMADVPVPPELGSAAGEAAGTAGTDAGPAGTAGTAGPCSAAPPPSPGAVVFAVRPREQRLILAKRRAMEAIRRLLP